MTREQAKAKLVELGVAEPTDEQVTNFLNTVNADSNSTKAKIAELQAKLEESEELKAKLEELENKGLSDAEKAANDLKKANEEIAKLKAASVLSEVRGIFGSAGLTEESYSGFLDGFASHDLETAKTMANALVTTLKTAKDDTEKKIREELLDGTKGGGKGGKEGEKTESDKIAETVGKSLAGNSKASQDIIANYK